MFKGNIITLLTSLLEGEIDMDIINRMTHGLDFKTMKVRICTIFVRFAEKMLKQENLTVKNIPIHRIDAVLEGDSFEDNIQEAFQIYILLHSLADSIDIAKDQLMKETFSFD